MPHLDLAPAVLLLGDDAADSLTVSSPVRTGWVVAAADADAAARVLSPHGEVDQAACGDGLVRVLLTHDRQRLERDASEELASAGIAVVAARREQLVDQVSTAWLLRQAAGCVAQPHGTTDHRVRMSALTGLGTAAQLLDLALEPDQPVALRAEAAGWCGPVLQGDPAVELVDAMLHAAAALTGLVRGRPHPDRPDPVAALLSGVLSVLGGEIDHVSPTRSPSLPDPHLVDETSLPALIAHPWPDVAVLAVQIAAALPEPRLEATVAAAVAFALAHATKRDDRAMPLGAHAARLLAVCPPAPEVLSALLALCDSPAETTREYAVYALGAVGDEADLRALWEGWATSRSRARVQHAGWIAARAGDARDVDLVLRSLEIRLLDRKLWFPLDSTAHLEHLVRHGATDRLRAVLDRARRGPGVVRTLDPWIDEHAPELAAAP